MKDNFIATISQLFRDCSTTISQLSHNFFTLLRWRECLSCKITRQRVEVNIECSNRPQANPHSPAWASIFDIWKLFKSMRIPRPRQPSDATQYSIFEIFSISCVFPGLDSPPMPLIIRYLKSFQIHAYFSAFFIAWFSKDFIYRIFDPKKIILSVRSTHEIKNFSNIEYSLISIAEKTCPARQDTF